MKLKSDGRRISRHFKELYCLEIVVPAEKKWDITELRLLPCFLCFCFSGIFFSLILAGILFKKVGWAAACEKVSEKSLYKVCARIFQQMHRAGLLVDHSLFQDQKPIHIKRDALRIMGYKESGHSSLFYYLLKFVHQ